MLNLQVTIYRITSISKDANLSDQINKSHTIQVTDNNRSTKHMQ
jgi:hypothetical protein